MIKVKFLISVLLFSILGNQLLANQDSLSFLVKQAILNDDIEKALIHLPDLEIDQNTKSILKKQAQKQNLSIEDHVKFLKIINLTKGITVQEFSSYIERNMPTPSTQEPLNYEYALIKWQEITWLVDDSEFDRAAIAQKDFAEYVSAFDPQDRDTKRAKVLVETYHMVMHQIQNEAIKGKERSKKCEKWAIEVKDTSLILLANYYFADFLIQTGELEFFIETCENSLKMEKEYSKTSTYYSQTIMHLIDAYLYKGGYEAEVFSLILQLMDDPTNGAAIYSYVVNYLEKIEIPSAESEIIFSKLGVSSIPEFCQKIDSVSKRELNSMDYYYVLYKLSLFNEAHGDFTEALLYLHDANQELKKTYSKELATSLANYETTLLKNAQEQELEKKQQKYELQVIISILSFFLFLITILLFWQRIKKDKILLQKNQEITQQRDDLKKKDQEKALLLRETHHRVKNNFQVISSLLELQSVGIEDKKALEITREGKNRINSMALIHKKLYENEEFLMYFDDYINKLSNDLCSLYGLNAKEVLHLDIDHLAFDLDTVIPLGLIINELITNALKYGLSNPKPSIHVSLKKVDEKFYALKVNDNGNGISQDFDLSQVSSLGLTLVKSLSKQLQGSFTMQNKNGTQCTVSFQNLAPNRTI